MPAGVITKTLITPRLESLYLVNTQMARTSWQAIRELGGFTNLYELDVSDNSEVSLDDLGKMHLIRSLAMSGCP